MAEQRYWSPFFLALQQGCPCVLLSSKDERAGQLRLQLRVAAADNKRWLAVNKLVAHAAILLGVTTDLSQEYVLQPSGAWAWAWRLILQHQSLESQLPALVAHLQGPLAVEEKEIPLHGSPNRHRNVRPVTSSP
jgi:hypothetical protein